jgi:hypothetical protein
VRFARTLALAVGALVVGVLSGTAGTLLHTYWWALALALVTGLAVVAALPPGGIRLAFALGWCVPVLRGTLERPGGGYLIASDAAGWSYISGSFVLLLAALATIRSGTRRADDPRDRPASA